MGALPGARACPEVAEMGYPLDAKGEGWVGSLAGKVEPARLRARTDAIRDAPNSPEGKNFQLTPPQSFGEYRPTTIPC